jgi:hypothetical protein
MTILFGIVVWIITNFLFHLTALLFNGQSTFNRFLFMATYPYIIPAIMVLVGIFTLDGLKVPNTEEALIFLMNNHTFRLAMNLISYSFVPYYLMLVILIHHVYQIKYVYAILSIVIPVVSIWLSTTLFKLI